MNSGIYLYTFANGDNYIGQAIDIEKRWDQHIQKMKKGQHTKLIQAAYNVFGLPEFRVMLECHPNYLDPMEAWCINRWKPTLNGNIPVCHDDTPEHFDITDDMLRPSLFRTLYELQRLRVAEEETEKELVELETEKRRLERRLVLVAKEAQPKELQDYIQQLEEDAGFLSTQLKISESVKARQYQQLKMAEDRIYQYIKLPWYKRIFHTV